MDCSQTSSIWKHLIVLQPFCCPSSRNGTPPILSDSLVSDYDCGLNHVMLSNGYGSSLQKHQTLVHTLHPPYMFSFQESWESDYPLTVLIGRLIILLWPTLLLYHTIRITMSFAFMISLNLL